MTGVIHLISLPVHRYHAFWKRSTIFTSGLLQFSNCMVKTFTWTISIILCRQANDIKSSSHFSFNNVHSPILLPVFDDVVSNQIDLTFTRIYQWIKVSNTTFTIASPVSFSSLGTLDNRKSFDPRIICNIP